MIQEKEEQWISVFDQLPEEGQTVFVMSEGFEGKFKFLYEDGKFKYNMRRIQSRMPLIPGISHWMPIPEKHIER